MAELLVAVYWGVRQENQDSCSRHTFLALKRLGEIHPKLKQWNQKAYSRAEALRRSIEISQEGIAKVLEPYHDDTGHIMKDLGYTFSAWNGILDNNDLTASFKTTCGCYYEGLTNNALLHLLIDCIPRKLCTAEQLRQMFMALVEAYEPQEGVVSSRYIQDRFPDFPFTEKGWLIYKKSRGKVELRECLPLEELWRKPG